MRDERAREWPITEVVALTGTTSRTLRHYGDLGLLPPSRVGENGYRYYDQHALVRLQRILLLRRLGLGLPEIGRVIDEQLDVAEALDRHVRALLAEQEQLGRRLASVRRTLAAIKDGKDLEMTEMFDGFDHTRYRDEVEQRWGKDAYASGASWWEAKSPDEKTRLQAEQKARSRAWTELSETDASPDSPAAQRLAAEHVDWLRGVPGTPAASGDPTALRGYVLGLAELYVADERFAANYGGAEGAAFVKAALEHYVATVL
ncbi:MerR family transcriptional regulator [Gryllotalpicola protaetiae]|uniref:MerR family transcriptional regulator n=1 Tax=Gryllotalpicola protaetiae TaxID=2419771 RepID=A0A387BPJ3_9MICO|nr:TipAS antibiotic-recognition domain-containing protein [Gryllotalpicola protaetiae]AYG03039.1 MerR family transcriptional regulator [Gryllotalpicola protaetiae]